MLPTDDDTLVEQSRGLAWVLKRVWYANTIGSPAPNWVLRTAIGPASMAGVVSPTQ